MSFLAKVDIFGENFQFTTNGKPKYTSVFGGVLSLSCFLILVVFVYFFGHDFYYRTNAKIISSTVYPTDFTTMRFNPNRTVIAWLLEDFYATRINFTGVLFPKLTFFSFEFSKETHTLDLNYTYDVVPKRCSEYDDIDPNFKKSRSLEEWYCFDFGDFNWGGAWETQFVNYVYFSIDTCDTNGQCSDLQKILDLTPGSANKLFFSILYPIYSFSPENLTHPIHVEYLNFYETIDPNIIKKAVYQFKEVKCEDDQGWIFTTKNTTSVLAFDRRSPDMFYRTTDSYKTTNEDNINTLIYASEFYFTKNFDVYQRSFMKVQDLAAVVGGLMKAILFSFSLFANFYNSIWSKLEIINAMFDFSPPEKKEGGGSFLKFEAENQSIEIFKKGHMTKIFKDPADDVDIEKKLKDIQERKKKHNISLSFYTKKFLCEGKVKSKDKTKYTFYNLADNVIRRKLDVYHYLRLAMSFEKLKSILFNHEQLLCFESPTNINLYNPKDYEKTKILEYKLTNGQTHKEMEKFIEHYKSKLKQSGRRELNLLDMNLINGTDEWISRLIKGEQSKVFTST